MSSSERRQAIAHFVRLEHFAASSLLDRSNVPHVRAGAQLVADRLHEIESVFLETADRSGAPWRERWLNAAERWLEFYTCELRRLQDREADHANGGAPWTSTH